MEERKVFEDGNIVVTTERFVFGASVWPMSELKGATLIRYSLLSHRHVLLFRHIGDPVSLEVKRDGSVREQIVAAIEKALAFRRTHQYDQLHSELGQLKSLDDP